MNQTGLASLTTEKLNYLTTQAATYANKGETPQYLPRLSAVDRHSLAIAVKTNTGKSFVVGESHRQFSLMSVVKPFLLLYLLSQLGSTIVFQRVDVEPSEEPFNSLMQLKADQGKPRNPMINSGAIALAGLLPGKDPLAKCLNFCDWLNYYGGCQLSLDNSMLNSIIETPNLRNQGLAELLQEAGYVDSHEQALANYNHICCLSGNISDLVNLGIFLESCPSPILPEHCRIVKALMMTCGLYEASARLAIKIGLPTKSGVSGAILAIVPGEGAIACYSPPLDAKGNSVAGLFLLEQLSATYNLSIFS